MITGKMFRDGIISGAHNIQNHQKAVDALNVFPVPDGDTGTNMSMTISMAAKEMELLPDDVSIAEASAKCASALLRGARGNSGVILSLIFRGFSKAFKGMEEADGAAVADAFDRGTKAAYKAVMKPTEGTILTVVRYATDGAKKALEKSNDPITVCDGALNGAKQALALTPELLPVLKEAGVVDAGGQGLIFIFEGFESVFDRSVVMQIEDVEAEPEEAEVQFVDAEYNYAFSFTIQMVEGGRQRDPEALKIYIESVAGDVNFEVTGKKIFVSAKTNELGHSIQTATRYGQLIDIDIKNLKLITPEEAKEAEEAGTDEAQKTAEPVNDYGFVAVCAGEGLTGLFKDIGVDIVVSGGQTMNPSTDDILNAVLATPAKVVYVFPNNKNIIMAAEQTTELVSDRQVVVVGTKTVPEGISAILAFDETETPESNVEIMTEAIGGVSTAQVTFAARDSEVDGKFIKEGEIMGLCDGDIQFLGHDVKEIAVNSALKIFNKDFNSLLTIIYGENATEEQATDIATALKAELSDDVEISIIDGGQPIYYFIISAE